MSVRNLQNEKIVEEVINRLTASHGIDAAQGLETRKIHEENRQIKIEIENQN